MIAALRQLAAEQLPRRVCGGARATGSIGFGTLKLREPLGRERAQLGRASGADGTSAVTASPHCGIRAAEHAGLSHRGMGQQDRLDLGRHHVLAAADDGVDLAAGDDQPTALVEAAEVARAQHAAARDRRALDQDLAVDGDR